VIVEKMGFADEDYRARKQRTHASMRAAYGGAPLAIHDLAGSDRGAQQRDFGKAVVRSILGSGGRP
jgi:hypothetical protein